MIAMAQAYYWPCVQRAMHLEGQPIGGWGDTMQARRELEGALPCRSDRAWTVEDFVAAVYDTAGERYVRRDLSDTMRRMGAALGRAEVES